MLHNYFLSQGLTGQKLQHCWLILYAREQSKAPWVNLPNNCFGQATSIPGNGNHRSADGKQPGQSGRKGSGRKRQINDKFLITLNHFLSTNLPTYLSIYLPTYLYMFFLQLEGFQNLIFQSCSKNIEKVIRMYFHFFRELILSGLFLLLRNSHNLRRTLSLSPIQG